MNLVEKCSGSFYIGYYVVLCSYVFLYTLYLCISESVFVYAAFCVRFA